MSSELTLTYLDHSGFIVETEQQVLVFDYYRDSAKVTPEHLTKGKPVWIFSSHAHADHFNPQIAAWQDNVTKYILSSDIRQAGGLSNVAADKLIYMNQDEQNNQGDLQISTFGSTDEGISFLVEVDGWRIFHAGDLNWWHWKGDTEENLQFAKDGFFREMDKLGGQSFDVAFFPVDSRLEEYRELGVREFCKRTNVRQLVAMHLCGQAWIPDETFITTHPAVAAWSPNTPGDKLSVLK
ncbi:MAG TPA: MBL fold metallo-hydrolase [Sporomusaceae bacterium]|nr:MBL fold metallo-hydrolase [Sporomusaceae bacterium]